MRQKSLATVLLVGLVLAVLTALQPAAAAQGCTDCGNMAAAVAHCQPDQNLATPQPRSGWPVPDPAAQAIPWPMAHRQLDAAEARAERLSEHVPEVSNLSIFLLNLRQ